MIIILSILVYFLCLLALSWLTSRKADNRDFFNARHSSPWPMVAFGMIGASVGAGLVEAAAKLPLKRGRICIYWGVQLMGTHKQARSKLEKKKSLADFNG